MSFILDALKKSEQERERQKQPTVVEIPYGYSNRRQPLWLMIVVGLLLLNCVLLLLMWWRSSHAPTPAVAPVVTPAVTTAAPASTASSSASQNVGRVIAPPRTSEVRPLLDEAGEPEALDETATTLTDDSLPAGPPLVRPTTGLDRAIAQQEAQANSAKMESLVRSTVGGGTNPTRTTSENIPTLESLGGSGTMGLPPMRLDVHVYSSVATERFAFINGHKYQEGQVLTEGPTVEKITQDGAILNYRGQRFLMPRQ
jgi:general secretion pathway protein B